MGTESDELAHDELASERLLHDEIAHDEIAHDQIAHDEPVQNELARDVEQKREHIAETIDALEAKADVRTRASEAVSERAHNVVETAVDASGRLDTGKLVLGGASAAALGLLVWRVSRRRG